MTAWGERRPERVGLIIVDGRGRRAKMGKRMLAGSRNVRCSETRAVLEPLASGGAPRLRDGLRTKRLCGSTQSTGGDGLALMRGRVFPWTPQWRSGRERIVLEVCGSLGDALDLLHEAVDRLGGPLARAVACSSENQPTEQGIR